MIWRWIRRSKTFDKKANKAIGRMSPMVRGDKTLLSARTSDFFHADGKMDYRIDVLKISSRWTPFTGKAEVTTLLGILSTPLVSVEKCATALDTSGTGKVTCERDNNRKHSTSPSSAMKKPSTSSARGSKDIPAKCSFSCSAEKMIGTSNPLKQKPKLRSSFHLR